MNKRAILYDILDKIPERQIISYGLLAQRINIIHRTSRNGWLVGRLLSNMPRKDRDIHPRWRVVNRHGQVTSLKTGERGILQVQKLEAEGISVKDDYVDKNYFLG